MKDSIQFRVSASLIKKLGEQIIPDPISALVELIKNAYDADAEEVTITINTRQRLSATTHFTTTEVGYIKVTDNGNGMSASALQEKWLRLSFSSKAKLKAEATTEKKRAPLGGQGMGRLGTVHLGQYIEVQSSTGTGEVSHLGFDWNVFNDQNTLAEVRVFTKSEQKQIGKGTQILVYPLHHVEQWEAKDSVEWAKLITERILYFIHRTTFKVSLNMNGEETPLHDKAPVANTDNGVYIQNVWGAMTSAVIEEVLAFWKGNKMLREGVASVERANQVVLVVRSQSTRQIVGVSTAGAVIFKQLNNNKFYLYRSIILPGYRHPGLPAKMIVETRDTLEHYSKAQHGEGCIGMLAFVENPGIQQFRREAIWPASKMAFIGVDKSGRHIRVCYFAGTLI